MEHNALPTNAHAIEVNTSCVASQVEGQFLETSTVNVCSRYSSMTAFIYSNILHNY